MTQRRLQLALQLLKPLLRLFLRWGLRHQELGELLKVVYTEVAKEELLSQGQTVNVSRVSAMTGVHRRDAQRLLAQSPKIKQPRDVLNRILAQWENDKRFTTKSGAARILSYEGEGNDFVKLVHSVSKELNPYTILFELERSGTVEKTAKGLELRKHLLLVQDNFNEGLALLAQDSRDLMQAVEENLTTKTSPRNLHLKTCYDNIPQSKVSEIRQWILEEGSAFHERLRQYLSHFDRDVQNRDVKGTGGLQTSTADNAEPAIRVAVGTFSITEPVVISQKTEAKRGGRHD